MVHRTIQTTEDLAEGMAWLTRREPRFVSAYAATGQLPLRNNPDGFGSLLNAIVSQQLSVASAAAIWKRLQLADLVDAQSIVTADDGMLRSAGLSRQKIRYARALADSGIDFVGLRECDDEQVVAQLTGVSGIGVWTAQIYALFSLSRADIFAAGDLALQQSARSLFALSERPSDAALRAMAEAWSPWRSVAARLLWSYYHVIKDREGIA
jgi:DNA-3-methyladenine glycosylase II